MCEEPMQRVVFQYFTKSYARLVDDKKQKGDESSSLLIHDLKRVHKELCELYFAWPPVLLTVVPQLEMEIHARVVCGM
jgi:hypothetical protein